MIATLRESKARLSELVQLASGGEEVLITVRGKPRARLVAAAQGAPEKSAWMLELARLRSGQQNSAGSIACLDELREDRW